MNEILTMATIIAPITDGKVQMIKQAKNINKRYLPAVAIVVGIGLDAAAYFLHAELGLRVLTGGISGLALTGLFVLRKGERVNCCSFFLTIIGWVFLYKIKKEPLALGLNQFWSKRGLSHHSLTSGFDTLIAS